MSALPCKAHYYQRIDVSVVIPFFNPAANIEDCLTSMVNQTLDPSRFEVVLIDDGSTDGSPARVAEWVARFPSLMSVRRIPASGWPGRPRNVGIDAARGCYIQFVDADDSLAPRALERLLAIADESAADVVVGKLSSDFRGIYHRLFRETVTHRTLADYPLAENLTVCKMFRRDFLREHGIRFSDTPRHAEDQHLCLQAYAHAKSVAVVGDLACYFYRRRRTGGLNLGDTWLVPSEYYRDVGWLLDVMDAPGVVPAARRSVQTRIYRTHVLGRLRGSTMIEVDAGYRHDMVSEARRLATSRFPAEVHEGLPTLLRAQSRMLFDDDAEGLLSYAQKLERINLHATISAPRWQDGRLVISIDAHLRVDSEPLRLDRHGNDWTMPESMAPGVGLADRTFGLNDDGDVDLDLATVSREDSQSWSTTAGLSLEIDADGCPRIQGEVQLDPAGLVGGGKLPPGRWDIRLRVGFGGLRLTAPVRPGVAEPAPLDTWVTADWEGLHSVSAYWTRPSPTLALDVGEWTHSLHDLFDDQDVDSSMAISDRGLTIDASRLRGPATSAGHPQLILEPVDDAGLGLVTVAAALEIRPEGSSISALIPTLPGGEAAWTAWLRIGAIGGPPPRRLPVTVDQDGEGRLSVRS